MRKFYFLLSMIAIFFCAIPTKAAYGDLNLKFTNPEHIDLIVYNNQVVDPIQEVVCVTPSWMSDRKLQIYPKPGYKFDSWDAKNMWGDPMTVGSVNAEGTFELTVAKSGFGDATITFYTSAEGQEKEYRHVTFDINDGAYDAIRRVAANGVAFESWEWSDPDGFDVELDAKLAIEIDKENYKIDLFEVDGEDTSAREFNVAENMTFKIEAHKYGMFNISIAGDTQLFTPYTGSSESNKKPVEYEGFSLQIDEKQPYLWIMRNPGFKVTSAKDENGNDLPVNERFTVHNNMVLNVEGGELEYDQDLVVFGYHLALAESPELVTNDGKSFALKEGYQTINFAAEDNIVSVHLKNADGKEKLNTLYLNDESQKGNDFKWSFNYIPVKHNDVILAFVGGEPEKHAISVNMGEYEAPFKVVRHGVAETEDPSAFEMYHGTEFSIIPTSDIKLKVTLDTRYDDETGFETDGDGAVHFTVTGPLALVVNNADGSAVTEIEAVETEGREVYNLQGIRVVSDKLPAGLYIINGKKVIVK